MSKKIIVKIKNLAQLILDETKDMKIEQSLAYGSILYNTLKEIKSICDEELNKG